MTTPITFSLAGVWQPINSADITNVRNGNLSVLPYAQIDLDSTGRAGLVLSGWSWGGSFGAGTSVTPVNIAIFAETQDGTMQLATDKIVPSATTNGSNSVVVTDFNNDGRDDILLLAHNESPFLAKPSTAYISEGTQGFKKTYA